LRFLKHKKPPALALAGRALVGVQKKGIQVTISLDTCQLEYSIHYSRWHVNLLFVTPKARGFIRREKTAPGDGKPAGRLFQKF
jgi:hypothetical protein